MTDRDAALNHYQLLQVKTTASPQEIRRAYRDLSKLYHPDTTTLSATVATEKFKLLNDAYATLSNPERRLAYDYSIGISKLSVIQAPAYLNRPAAERRRLENRNAYLDPTDRPLSPGELFALFILGVTFVGCLILVFTVGWTKGELVLQSPPLETVSGEAWEAPESSDPAETTRQAPTLRPSTMPKPNAPSPDSPPAATPDAPRTLPWTQLSPKMI